MTYEEFLEKSKRILKDDSLEIHFVESKLKVGNAAILESSYGVVLYVNTIETDVLDCSTGEFLKFSKEIREKLLTITMELAKTPISERSFEQEFYFKHTFFDCDNSNGGFLTMYIKDSSLSLSYQEEEPGYKKTFTAKDVEYLEEFFSFDFSNFDEPIPVKRGVLK